MRIRKYDFDYSRRFFLEKTARGLGGAGVLGALWPEICRSGEIDRAYPEELTDIEAYTKGAVKVGDVIDADNIDLVQDIVDPVLYEEVKQDRRKFFIESPATDIETMFPPYFLDATIRNQGRAVFGGDGNVYTDDGAPWVGGLPFPDPQTGEEAIANITLSWGRHDSAMYAVPSLVVNANGDIAYEYDFMWAELQCTGLVRPDAPGPYLPGHEDKVRFQTILFTHTNDVRGSAFLNIWKYDQNEFPDLFGYLPQFKRVRRFPANQRFEPYMPGMNLFLSDAWASGDPMLTWGNFKIVHRGPFLGSTHNQWLPANDNWLPPLIGGAKDQTYFYVGKSLIPEVIVFEGEPIGYPRAPVSKRRVYVDARNMGIPQAISYDRQGLPWKGFEAGAGQRKAGEYEIRAGDGRPEWSWDWVISHDVQANNVTRFHQGEECRGSWRSKLDPDEDVYSNYMTVQALRRLGI
ncbi:MAG: DUF1329 domain-containing protein [Gammaproteobacteria bacterium]|nr:DUF1329 domain-containing protein [Gammaproteobacteria bacterium]